MRMFIPIPGEEYRILEEITLDGNPNFLKLYKAMGIQSDSPHYFTLHDWRRVVIIPPNTVFRVNSLWFQPSWSKLISITLYWGKRKPRIYLTRDQLAQIEVERLP